MNSHVEQKHTWPIWSDSKHRLCMLLLHTRDRVFENLGKSSTLQSSAQQKCASLGLGNTLLNAGCSHLHSLSITTIESNGIKAPVKEPLSLKSSEILWKSASNRKYKPFEKYNVKEIRIAVPWCLHGKNQEKLWWGTEVSPSHFLSITKVSPNKSS